MTKYLVQKFFWLREKSLIQISQKTLVSLFPFFSIFRNHSGDRSIGLLRSRLYPSALFDG